MCTEHRRRICSRIRRIIWGVIFLSPFLTLGQQTKNGGCSLIEVWTLLPGHKPTLCMAWVGTLVLAPLSSLWTVKSKETGSCSFLRKLVIPSPLRGCLRSPCWNLATFPHHFWPWFIKNRPINQVFPAGWGSTFTFLLCCFLDLIWLIELLVITG